MSEIGDEFASSPIGMQSRTSAAELTYQPGHPQLWEQNDPIAYSQKPDYTDDPLAFLRWRRQRSDEQATRQAEV